MKMQHKRSGLISVELKNLRFNLFISLVIKGGKGCFLEDIDGKKYLDFSSNIASCPLGYTHPELMNILKKYLNEGVHKIAGQDFYCEEHLEIAERLIYISGKNFKTLLINSGAETVENALKIVYRKTGPLPGVCCMNSFHGRTLGSLSFTNSKEVQKINFPEFPVKRIKFCTVDDDLEINRLEHLCEENKIAFVISEIIQGEGGVNVASRKFIKNLYGITRKYHVLLIIDEVQTGIGRTGRWWAYEHYDIKPDIITVAKSIQIGAVLFDQILEPKRKGVLSSTWGGGSRIDMAIGAKTIEIIHNERLPKHAEKMGRLMIKRLEEIKQKFDSITGVRGLGLMIGVEFKSAKERDRIIMKLFKVGLLVLPARHKTIRILPPLIIFKEEINLGIEIIIKVIKEGTKK